MAHDDDVLTDAEEKDKGKKKLKPRVVKAEAALAMLRATTKRAKAETALHLLHAVVAGPNGAHIGLTAADVTGIQVLLVTSASLAESLIAPQTQTCPLRCFKPEQLADVILREGKAVAIAGV